MKKTVKMLLICFLLLCSMTLTQQKNVNAAEKTGMRVAFSNDKVTWSEEKKADNWGKIDITSENFTYVKLLTPWTDKNGNPIDVDSLEFFVGTSSEGADRYYLQKDADNCIRIPDFLKGYTIKAKQKGTATSIFKLQVNDGDYASRERSETLYEAGTYLADDGRKLTITEDGFIEIDGYDPASQLWDSNKILSEFNVQSDGTCEYLFSYFPTKKYYFKMQIAEDKQSITGISGDLDGVTFTRYKAVESLTLNKQELSLYEGESEILQASITPQDATEQTLTWKTSDETIARVDQNGKVEALKEGTATISASTLDGVSATCEVKVKKIQMDFPKWDGKPVEEISIFPCVDETTPQMLFNSLPVSIKDALEKIMERPRFVFSIKTIDKKQATGQNKEDIAQIEAFLKKENKYTLAQYFDFSIGVKTDTNTLGYVEETLEKVTFEMKLPEEYEKEGRCFYMLRVHDGELSLLEVEKNKDTLTFESDQFSTYALVYENQISATTPDKVDTNDSAYTGYYMLLLVASSLVLGIFYRKKSSN